MRERNRRRFQGQTETYEIRVYRRNGSSFWAEVHATPYRNGAGEIIGTLGALTDITQRRELEGQLRQSQKMEAVGQLAAGIAHNFNNMLQAIMGSLSVALMKAQGDLKSHLLDAEESSQRASEIVRQLMLFARHGRRGEFRPVDLQHALANTVDLCRRSFDRRIDVSLRVPQTLLAHRRRRLGAIAAGLAQRVSECPRCAGGSGQPGSNHSDRCRNAERPRGRRSTQSRDSRNRQRHRH